MVVENRFINIMILPPASKKINGENMTTEKTALSADDINRVLTRMAYEIMEIHKGVKILPLLEYRPAGLSCKASESQNKGNRRRKPFDW